MRTTILFRVLLLAALVFCSQVQAQNLVPNPGFETLSGSPTTSGSLNLAQPWQSLNATPDIYAPQTSLPVNPCDNVNVPNNVGGYAPVNISGNAYAGIQIDPNNNYREYISVPLTVQLIANELYRVEFWVLLADSSRYSCNRLGALFTNNIPIQSGTGVINFTPQIESANIQSDTGHWTLVTGIYQATGVETYVTIGVFRDDTSPLFQKLDLGAKNSGCSSMDNSAYYYIDDVVVRPVTETVEITGDTILCPGEGTSLYANTNVPFWWSDENDPTDTISLSAFLTISPTVPTKYYLNGLFVTDSVTVTIVPAPYVNLGPDSMLCRNDSIKLDAFGTDVIRYEWSNADTNSYLYVRDTGTYYVEVENAGCTASDTINITDFLPNPIFTLGEDSTYCFFIADSLTLSAPIADSYLWKPGNETTPELTVQYPALYSCTITRSNGCTSTAWLDVAEVCEPSVFIPNAFTPDEDGINDYFGAFVNNATSYSLRIQNRRGQTIFYTEDPSGAWDGKYEGTDAPIGVYVYRLNYSGLDSEGSKVKRKILGTITLFR